MSPRETGSEMRNAPGVHRSTQIPQALHNSLSTRGFCHSLLFCVVHTTPDESVIAFAGQILPHTPHSTQRLSFMMCRNFASPVMAKTGQARAQAVHPTHASVICSDMLTPFF
jgi:hypothetical protein